MPWGGKAGVDVGNGAGARVAVVVVAVEDVLGNVERRPCNDDDQHEDTEDGKEDLEKLFHVLRPFVMNFTNIIICRYDADMNKTPKFRPARGFLFVGSEKNPPFAVHIFGKSLTNRKKCAIIRVSDKN